MKYNDQAGSVKGFASALMTRRDLITIAGISVVGAIIPSCAGQKGRQDMYGLIGKINVVPGQRDALIAILVEGISGMPGCLSYIVAKDSTDPNAIWVTEVWERQESHQESLSLPTVQQAITLGRPLITGFGERFETIPVGGQGLVS